jgi:hypothetical protein
MKRSVTTFALLALVLSASPTWAAPSPTLLTSGADSVDRSSYTSASVTAHANQLILACVGGAPNDNTSQSVTVSGFSATWVEVALADTGSIGRFAACYRTMLGSDQTGTVVFNFNETQLRAAWSVVEFSGVDTSGTNGSGAVVQAPTAVSTSATSLTVTFSAFGNANNRPYCFFRFNNVLGLAAGSGWTSGFPGDTIDSEGVEILGEWRNATDDTTCDATATGSAQSFAGIGVEVKAAATGGGAGCILGGGIIRPGCPG